MSDQSASAAIGDHDRVPGACVGIEFYPVCMAPFGEVVRVYINSDDLDAAGLKLLARSLGFHEPLFISPVEFITIIKHSPELGKGLGPEPGHSDDFHHENTSCINISSLDDFNRSAEFVLNAIKDKYGDNMHLVRAIIDHAHHQLEMSMKAEIYKESQDTLHIHPDKKSARELYAQRLQPLLRPKKA